MFYSCITFLVNQPAVSKHRRTKYECTMDQVLYMQNDVAAMPGAGRCCVLFSFARCQHLSAQLDVAAIVYMKWCHGCSFKILRSNQKFDSINWCIYSLEEHTAKSHDIIPIRFVPCLKTFLQNDVMAAIMKMWRHIRNPALSIDAYSLEEQSRHMSSWSDLKRRSLRLFFLEVVPTRRKRRRRVAIWDQCLISSWSNKKTMLMRVSNKY